jgi:Ca-activated chloride channel family protein
MAKSGWKANGMRKSEIHRRSFLATCLGGATAFAQEADIRVDVRLVRVLATVKDAAGGLVGSLNRDDFDVLDNGAAQQISVFERQTAQPLSVALLVDTSGSTAKDLKFEVDSVTRFLHALFGEGNPQDTVALYSFNYDVVQQKTFTRSESGLASKLHQLHGEGGTALYDAIYLAARELQRRQGRKVMLIVTDGGDTVSGQSYHSALNEAQLADAVIYPVLVVPIAGDAGRNIGGEHALTTLAKGTGGRVFEPTLGSALDAAFSDILRELRTQYLLAYYPHDVPLTKDRFHHLELRVHRPQLQVIARNGYYGEASK